MKKKYLIVGTIAILLTISCWWILSARSDARMKRIASNEFYMYLGDSFIETQGFVGPEELQISSDETKYVWTKGKKEENWSINIIVPRYIRPPHYGDVDITLDGDWKKLAGQTLKARQEQARNELSE